MKIRIGFIIKASASPLFFKVWQKDNDFILEEKQVSCSWLLSLESTHHNLSLNISMSLGLFHHNDIVKTTFVYCPNISQRSWIKNTSSHSEKNCFSTQSLVSILEGIRVRKRSLLDFLIIYLIIIYRNVKNFLILKLNL